MPGPPRKRDAERRRKNAPAIATITVDFEAVAGQTVSVPAPREDWHTIAHDWYMSLTQSLQTRFYEPSDWALAVILADQLSLELKPRPVQVGTDDEGNPVFETRRVPMIGAKLTALLKGMTDLMVSEASRRRLAIETQREEPAEGESATVTSITQNRRDLLG